VEKEREGWMKKYEEMIEKNNHLVEAEKERRMELEYEVKILRQAKVQNQSFNNTLNLSTNLELEN
jgi:hypothetical protein